MAMEKRSPWYGLMSEKLANSGYEQIIGLRDLYPAPREYLPELREFLDTELTVCAIPTDIFVAVMEIEAWFIEEWTHFPRIDPTLSMAHIENALHFNPSKLEAASLDHPAIFLDNTYQLVGHSYKKRKWQAQATMDYLDFAAMYIELPERVPELARLIQGIDQALS